MEGKYLVKSSEDQTVKTPAYGAVNACYNDVNDKEFEKGPNRIESSFDDKIKGMNISTKSCSCTVSFGDCDCGIKKKQIQFEPWAPYKTKAMVLGLSLFSVWIIAISIIGQQGKL